MSYRPIAEYGLIGDCRTAALVSSEGSIDWLCAPDFDSPALFARLLDARRGGHFSIRPAGTFESRMKYVENSAVLKTTFRTPSGTATLTDFMPLREGDGNERLALPHADRRVVRVLQGVRGEVEFLVDCWPRPDYGARAARVAAAVAGVRIDLGGGNVLNLRSTIPLGAADDHAAAEHTIAAGETVWFALDLAGDPGAPAAQTLAETLDFWRKWHGECRYRGPYRDAVMRALLGLKLLTYAPTGAMVAAPTTSLPEEIGGVRNWDYRYTWIRDASFAAHALFNAGHPEDMRRFMRWTCETALRCEPGDLHIMYGLRGERELAERTLDHLEGYRGSRPVRVGNAASTQFQLDAYGELLDCFEVFRRCELAPGEARDMWPAFRGQVDSVAARWREPDSSLWEMRSEPRHFVHSKAMAWVALDRGIAAAEAAGLPADLAHWRREREAIHEEVMRCGYDERLGSFVQCYGSSRSDAANLLLPIFGFIAPSHPRMRATIETIRRTLVSDGLVYRYRDTDDGLPGGEATFAACSFWLVENLAALGEVEQATRLFESLLERATPLGLFAEELEPDTGEQRGNFPQALTLLAVVNAAVALEEIYKGVKGRLRDPWRRPAGRRSA
jgi:GH15 family glucan-1,4-alpha-glucosidase